MRKLAGFLLAALGANVAVVAALPWLINAYVLHRVEQLTDGPNRAFHAPRPDATARGIVRPSPDLLYTACVYDLAAGSVRLSSPVPASYASISGFAADTTNFFALNDGDVAGAGARQLELYLADEGATDVPGGARVVHPPSRRGLVLFRTLIPNDSELAELRELQSRQRCEPLSGNPQRRPP